MSAFSISHIAWRRTYQSGYIELLCVFAHIYANHIVLGIKQIFRYALGQLGLAHPGRTNEKKGAYGPEWVLYAGAIPLNCPYHTFHGLLLSDYTVLEPLGHLQYLVPFGLGYIAHRYSCHTRNHCGNILACDNSGGLVQAYHRACFVHHVQSLVGQASVGEIALRHSDAGCQGFLPVMHPVVIFVVGEHPVQDFRSFGRRGGIYKHFLETPLQCPVFFYHLAEFIQGGGSDALKFPSCKGRLEYVCSVKAPGCTSGSDHRVNLVYEEYDVRIVPCIFDNLLHSFLEIAPVACSGHD